MSYLKQLQARLLARGETPKALSLCLADDGLWHVAVQYEALGEPVHYPRASTEHEAYEQALEMILDRPHLNR